jgi:DNA-binding CsgD family transcriptional regulator
MFAAGSALVGPSTARQGKREIAMAEGLLERRVRREDRPEQLRWIALARSLAASLDCMDRPWLLVVPEEPLRVWHANAAAREQLASGECLRMRDGLLLACGEVNTAALNRAVRAVSGGGDAHRLQLRTEGAALALRLQRLEFGASAELPVAQVLLVDVQSQPSPQRHLQRLRDAFGLTPREAECALGLYAIGSVDAMARCSGKSIHTVRTQLKAAMQKTATHTQAGLVALVARHLES